MGLIKIGIGALHHSFIFDGSIRRQAFSNGLDRRTRSVMDGMVMYRVRRRRTSEKTEDLFLGEFKSASDLLAYLAVFEKISSKSAVSRARRQIGLLCFFPQDPLVLHWRTL